MNNNNTLTPSDHDTLIRVETKFDTFSKQVIDDIRELKEGTQIRLAQTEARILALEKTHDEVKPHENYKKLQDLLNWKSNVDSNMKLMAAIASLIGGLIGVAGTVTLLLTHII